MGDDDDIVSVGYPDARLLPRPQPAAEAPVVWTYTAWQRPVHWPHLIAAIVVTVLTAAVVAIGHTAGLLATPVAIGAVLAMGVLWQRYLRIPVSGIHAHRPTTPDEREERR